MQWSTLYPVENSSLLNRPPRQTENDSSDGDSDDPPHPDIFDPSEEDPEMLSEARPVDPADLGDVSAEEVRQAPARAVRELATEGMVPSTFTSVL